MSSFRNTLACVLALVPGAVTLSAQGNVPVSTRRVWTADVSGGMFIEPRQGHNGGAAASVALVTRAGLTGWGPAALAMRSRVDCGITNPFWGYSGYCEWGLAALGAERGWALGERTSSSLGAMGGMLLSRNRVTSNGIVGPGLPPADQRTWDLRPAVVFTGRLEQRLSGTFSLVGRGTSFTPLFGDKLLGPSGLSGMVGLGVHW